VIAVQAEQAPTMYHTWRRGEPVPSPMKTRAEGLQTRVPFENTQRIMRDAAIGLDDFLLVDDDELEEAIRLLFEHTRNVAEHAGAAPLAAARHISDRIRGRRVVLVMSGGNLSPADLRRIFG
jgi:threonine dehydratase